MMPTMVGAMDQRAAPSGLKAGACLAYRSLACEMDVDHLPTCLHGKLDGE